MFLLFGLAICLAVVFIVAEHRKQQERQKRFASFAAGMGWRYSPEKRRDLEDYFPQFPFFSEGSDRYGWNFLSGVVGAHTVNAFDYHYSITYNQGQTTHTQHHEFTVILLQPPFPLKPLVIREHRFFDRVAAAFGWGDIDFESAEFSRLYHVSAPDRRWAFDVLTARNIEFLMSRRPEAIHMDHTRVMLTRRQVEDPTAILPECGTLAGFLDGIPDYARSPRPDFKSL